MELEYLPDMRRPGKEVGTTEPIMLVRAPKMPLSDCALDADGGWRWVVAG